MVKRLKAQLNDRFSLLEKADEELQRYLLEKETTEEAFADELISVLEYRDNFGDMNFELEELVGQDVLANNSQREVISGSFVQDIQSKYKLPKLELTKFSGDPKEWLGVVEPVQRNR